MNQIIARRNDMPVSWAYGDPGGMVTTQIVVQLSIALGERLVLMLVQYILFANMELYFYMHGDQTATFSSTFFFVDVVVGCPQSDAAVEFVKASLPHLKHAAHLNIDFRTRLSGLLLNRAHTKACCELSEKLLREDIAHRGQQREKNAVKVSEDV